jgi:hypothetical protein
LGLEWQDGWFGSIHIRWGGLRFSPFPGNWNGWFCVITDIGEVGTFRARTWEWCTTSSSWAFAVSWVGTAGDRLRSEKRRLSAADWRFLCAETSIPAADDQLRRISNGIRSAEGKFPCPEGEIACPESDVGCSERNIGCPEGDIVCFENNLGCLESDIGCPESNVACVESYVTCSESNVACAESGVFGAESELFWGKDADCGQHIGCVPSGTGVPIRAAPVLGE